MSVELKTPWIKKEADSNSTLEIYTVVDFREHSFKNAKTGKEIKHGCVWFELDGYNEQVRTESEFLAQYKPYEQYEYKYFYGTQFYEGGKIDLWTDYMTDEEFTAKLKPLEQRAYRKVEETKRVRQ